MKKLFKLSMAMFFALCFIFVSCGGNILNNISVQYGENDYGVQRIFVKNISDKTINGSFAVKINYYGGTSSTQEIHLNNLAPNDVQQFEAKDEFNNGIVSVKLVR